MTARRASRERGTADRGPRWGENRRGHACARSVAVGARRRRRRRGGSGTAAAVTVGDGGGAGGDRGGEDRVRKDGGAVAMVVAALVRDVCFPPLAARVPAGERRTRVSAGRCTRKEAACA